jgi:hypothetical protein
MVITLLYINEVITKQNIKITHKLLKRNFLNNCQEKHVTHQLINGRDKEKELELVD